MQYIWAYTKSSTEIGLIIQESKKLLFLITRDLICWTRLCQIFPDEKQLKIKRARQILEKCTQRKSVYESNLKLHSSVILYLNLYIPKLWYLSTTFKGELIDKKLAMQLGMRNDNFFIIPSRKYH